jgi:hypothetical protein
MVRFSTSMNRVLVIVLIALFFHLQTAWAWTSRTYQIIVVQSTKLMPATFQRIMRTHKDEILRGCLKPDDAGEDFHRYDLVQRSGFLEQRILELTQSIPAGIAAHRPFREIAEDFGRLSH